MSFDDVTSSIHAEQDRIFREVAGIHIRESIRIAVVERDRRVRVEQVSAADFHVEAVITRLLSWKRFVAIADFAVHQYIPQQLMIDAYGSR